MLNLKRNTVIPLIICAGLIGAAPLASAESSTRNANSAMQHAQQTFKDGIRQGQLETAYLFSDQLNPFKIDTDVHGKRVVLKGEVSTEVQKDLAGEIAKGIDGVKDVDNELKVTPDAKSKKGKTGADFATWAHDAMITAAIKTDFLTHSDIAGLNINVTTKHGVVTLQGKAKSDAVKELAGQIARNQENVVDVRNELKVTSS